MSPVRDKINKSYGLIIHDQSPKVTYGLKIKALDLRNIPRELADRHMQTLTKQRNLVVPDDSAAGEIL